MITWSLWVVFGGSIIGIAGIVVNEFDVPKALAAWFAYTIAIPAPFILLDYLLGA